MLFWVHWISSACFRSGFDLGEHTSPADISFPSDLVADNCLALRGRKVAGEFSFPLGELADDPENVE